MATSTLANSPSTPEFDGRLIDKLIDTVEQVQKPKPPQSAPEPDNSRDNSQDKNAAMLLQLWAVGETLVKPSFKDALHGFPDVNSYYADAAGR